MIGEIGDSVVFVEDESIIKLHVHTDHPGKVLEKAIEYGSLAMVKIENMKNQHSSLVDQQEKAPKASVPAKPEKKYGFVSVCLGSGIADAFRDVGVDSIIHGGQTMNPSTQDIIDAVNATPAEIVFVLPNNKNIVIIDDSYNSNVDGFNSAMQVLDAFAGRKIVLTPGLVELGKQENLMNFLPKSPQQR